MLFASLPPSTFDVGIMAGQSNMSGAPNPAVNEGGGVTTDLCWDWDGPLGYGLVQHMVEPWGSDPNDYKPQKGSMAPAFANALTAASGRQLLMVHTAIGGTVLLDDNAVPANSWGPDGDLFDNSVARAQAAITALTTAGHTIGHVFVLWSQGFADAKAGNDLSNYGAANLALVDRYRTALGIPGLQVYTEENYGPVGTPGVSAGTLINCETVKAQQLAVIDPGAGLHNAFNEGVSVIRANEWWRSDKLHYSITGLRYMGAGAPGMGGGFAAYVADDLGFGEVPYDGPTLTSHVAFRMRWAPPLEYPTPPAAPTFVRNLTGSSPKTAGTTVTVTLPANVPAGNTIVISAANDNKASSGPEITTVSVPGGETATWVQLGKTWGGGTGTTSVVENLIAIKTTQTWTSGTVITITYDSSTAARAAVGIEFAGVTTSLRTAVLTNTSAVGTASVTLAGLLTSDLVIGAGGWETTNAPTGDSDTTNGSWSSVLSISTAGGLEYANVTASLQYKILTADGSQTYNPVTGGSLVDAKDVGIVVAALQPAP